MGNATNVSKGTTGNKKSASYWNNQASTNGGKTLHPGKAAKMAKEAGYGHAAYQLDHANERQKAGIGDLDPAGFDFDFYKGRTWEGSKGHPAERQMYKINSDRETIANIPKAIKKFGNFLMPGSLLSSFTSTAGKKVKKSSSSAKIIEKSGTAIANNAADKQRQRVITSGDPRKKYNRTSLKTASRSKTNKSTLLG